MIGSEVVDLDIVVKRIQNDPAAAEFKIAIFSAALLSYRRSSCVLPFPPCFINADGTKCLEHLQNVFGSLPSLKDFCENPDQFSSDEALLLKWIIMGKKFEIESCKEKSFQELQDKTGEASFSLQPSHVFEVKYRNSQSCAKFDDLAQNYDIKYGYHGSRLDNFHSILHNGLQVHMTKNALFGEGIYLSEDLSVTMPYTMSGEVWKHSGLGEQLSCVAVCEILNHPLVKCKVEEKARARAKDSVGGDVPEKYFVVTNSDLVRLKYVLVYARNKAGKKKPQKWLIQQYPVASILLVYLAFLCLLGLWRSNQFQKFYKRHWVDRFFSEH